MPIWTGDKQMLNEANPYSDWPINILKPVPQTNFVLWIEFIACGLVNPGRVKGHPVRYPDFLNPEGE